MRGYFFNFALLIQTLFYYGRTLSFSRFYSQRYRTLADRILCIQRFHIQPEIEQAFEAKYHRVEDFLKVNNEHINHIPHIHLAECDNQFLDKLEAIINKYSPFENEEKIYCCLWIASVLYRKYDNFGKDHSNFDIDYLEQRICSTNILNISVLKCLNSLPF